MGKRLFASSIGEINELLVTQPLTHVPGTREWLLGIANVRGNLVPVVDLGRFLFDQRTQATDRSRCCWCASMAAAWACWWTRSSASAVSATKTATTA